MLVLTRRKGESFRIGDNITVTVVEASVGKIRIGIDAPKDVYIRRSELEPRPNRETYTYRIPGVHRLEE